MALFLVLLSGTSTASEAVMEEQTDLPHPQELALFDELESWEWQAASRVADRDLASALASGGTSRERESHRQLVASLPFGDDILAVADRYGLDSLLLAAVIEAESSFDAAAVSPRGAIGLMQLMPRTARSFGVSDAHDPRLNLEAGSRYLNSLLDRFDGDLGLALAAYNAGPTNVARYGGVPPFPETDRYVARVVRRFLEHHRSAWLSVWHGESEADPSSARSH